MPLGKAFLAATFLGMLFLGCSGQRALDSPNAGRTLAFQPGVPDFDMEVVGTVREGLPGVDLYLGIPHISLVFTRRDTSAYMAHFETLVRLMDRRGKDVIREFASRDTVWVDDYAATQVYTPFIKSQRVPLEPGDYVVEVVVTDVSSDQQAVRRQAVQAVTPTTLRPVLSRIRMEGRRDGRDFEPVVSLHIPVGLDSLRGIVELYNADRLDNLAVEMRLLRFPSDTTVATPPHWIQPLAGSLGYRGVWYHRPDTIQAIQRRLRNVENEITIEFAMPHLETGGVYRIEVMAFDVTQAATPETVLRQARDFTVRYADFPQVTHIEHLVEALVYITRRHEYEELKEAENPLEMKRRFDAFWGGLIPNKQVAANLLKLYYQRVEEANLYFSSYKEGWKTDRGMLYIVLGPPLYIDSRLDSEIWVYSIQQRSGVTSAYYFERVPVPGSDGTFYNYLLQRDTPNDYSWSRAFDRWRRGDVL